jgi:hypothetical protein
MKRAAAAVPDARVPRLGEGWASLARGLEARVRVIDPEAVIVTRIDPTGLLRFALQCKPPARAECAGLVAEYEAKATETCETCGSAGRVRSGVIVTVLCAHCAEPQ